jgi:hypothetical protein
MPPAPPPAPPEPARVRDALGGVVAVAAAAACVALLVLWYRSYVTYDELIVPGFGGELRLASNDGAVIIGVFGDERQLTFRFRRWGGPTEFGRLLGVGEDNPLPFAVAFGLSNFGIAVPHWAVAVPLALCAAWWLVVSRRRRVLRHRAGHGLCLGCGYDLRQSPERCPECGAMLSLDALEGAT